MVRLEIEEGHGADPYFVSPTGAHAQAALRALRAAFDREPVLLREGGSIPIVNDFKKVLGVDTLLLGLGLPDDNAHSPNEKYDLDNFENGQRMSALPMAGNSGLSTKTFLLDRGRAERGFARFGTGFGAPRKTAGREIYRRGRPAHGGGGRGTGL